METRTTTGRRRLLTAGAVLLALFLAGSAGWFLWRHAAYSGYRTDEMQWNAGGSWLGPSWSMTDAEGYSFNVKYPDYISLTGNLAVGMPVEDTFYTDSVIIWPLAGGGYEYGALLYDEFGWQIMIDAHGNALDPELAPVVQRHRESLELLLERAERMWGLGGA